jgi:hypothetical protein
MWLVRAHLAVGIAQAAPWGIALDRLLAAELWAEHKAARRATADPTPPWWTPRTPLTYRCRSPAARRG